MKKNKKSQTNKSVPRCTTRTTPGFFYTTAAWKNFSFLLRFLLVYAVENANSRETVGGCKHSIICKLNRSATCNRRQSTSSRSFAGLGSPEKNKKTNGTMEATLDIPVHFWCVSAPTSVPHCATVYRIAVALGFGLLRRISEILSFNFRVQFLFFKCCDWPQYLSRVFFLRSKVVLDAINRWHWKCQLCKNDSDVYHIYLFWRVQYGTKTWRDRYMWRQT
jgi:hypothetical protein